MNMGEMKVVYDICAVDVEKRESLNADIAALAAKYGFEPLQTGSANLCEMSLSFTKLVRNHPFASQLTPPPAVPKKVVKKEAKPKKVRKPKVKEAKTKEPK